MPLFGIGERVLRTYHKAEQAKVGVVYAEYGLTDQEEWFFFRRRAQAFR